MTMNSEEAIIERLKMLGKKKTGEERIYDMENTLNELITCIHRISHCAQTGPDNRLYDIQKCMEKIQEKQKKNDSIKNERKELKIKLQEERSKRIEYERKMAMERDELKRQLKLEVMQEMARTTYNDPKI